MSLCNFQQQGIQMSSYLAEFQTRITQHDLPAVMRLWEEYCAGDEVEANELKEILSTFKHSDLMESMGKQVEKIIPLWELLEETPDSKEIIKLIIDLQTTNQEYLRTLALSYLKNNYSDHKNFDAKIRLVGLRTKEDFQGSISHFELLNHMEKGNFVLHTGGWGVGEIMEISLLREQLSVEFEHVSGKKDLSFANAFKTLIPISKDHFLALRFGNPDLLEQKAKENSLETIRLLLRDLGPKTAAEIKDELCDFIIPAKEWTKWWQSARAKIKKDTLIQTPEDSKEAFKILSKEIPHEERFKEALESTFDHNALIQMIYSFTKDFSETLKKEEFKTFLQNKLSEMLSYKGLSKSQELQIYFFLSDLKDEKESAAISTLIKNSASIQDLIKDIEILSFKKRVMTEVIHHRTDWIEIFLDLLFAVDHGPLRDYLLAELLEVPEALAELNRSLQNLYTHPSKKPETFLWYFQKAMTNSALPYADKTGKNLLFESLLILLNRLEYLGTHKEAIKKIHTLLTNERYLIVRQIMQNANVDEVQEFLLLATKCHSLTDHDIKILHSLAEVVHPSLAKIRKKTDSTGIDNQIVWMTQEGYYQLQANIHKIATVDTVANAKEIETARSHGDLRENMEFKAAREKRDRLQTELKFLSDQLSRSRIITKEDISVDEVGIGSIVHCKNRQGHPLSYTILGPLEANPEKNILSFQSKLAQTMKGMSIGDKFQFQSEEYTITEITNFLDRK